MLYRMVGVTHRTTFTNKHMHELKLAQVMLMSLEL